jgi:hypothetical protein
MLLNPNENALLQLLIERYRKTYKVYDEISQRSFEVGTKDTEEIVWVGWYYGKWSALSGDPDYSHDEHIIEPADPNFLEKLDLYIEKYIAIYRSRKKEGQIRQ